MSVPYLVRPESIHHVGRGALSRSLERQVVALCARSAPHRIEALALDRGAPESLEALLDATRGLARPDDETPGSIVDASGRLIGERLPVWSGASDRTIWSRPEVNYLFRAWHDSHHILLSAGFDPRGELAVADHADTLIKGRAERAILRAEVWGQVAYHVLHGVFPDDQRGFVRDCIRRGLDETIRSGLYHRVGGMKP